MEKLCGQSAAILMLLAICFVGCTVTGTKSGVHSPQSGVYGPQSTVRSRAAFSVLDPQSSQSAQSVIVNPPSSCSLAWDYPADQLWLVQQFRIYSRSNAASGPWSLFATTTNLSLPFLPTNRSAFFYVTALGVNGLESEPNTK